MGIVTVGSRAMEYRRYLWCAAWAVFSVILGVLYVNLPRWIDHRWNDYLGSVLLEGGRPYIDVGANDFPGLFFLHALALGLFGYQSWSFRLLDYLLLLGFVLVVGRILAARQGTREALIFVPLYQLIYVTAGYGISGQRDLLAAHLDLVAGALLLWRIGGGHRAWLVPAGLAVLMAALRKPTYALFAPALPLIDLVARRQSGRTLRRIAADHAVWATTAGTVAAVLVAIGWHLDILGAWYEWAIAWNGEVYSGISRLSPAALFLRVSRVLLTFWPVYTAVAFVGGLLWWSSGDRPFLVLLLATAITTIASVILQGKLYYYHISALLPVLVLLMSHALAWASGTLAIRPPSWARAAAAVVLAALMFLMTTLALAKKVVSTYRIPVAWQLGRIGEDEYLKAYNLDGVPEVVAYVRAHHTAGDRLGARR